MALRLHFTLKPLHIVVAFIFCVAAFTRLWQLGQIPSGITWDEAAIGYIGQMVVQTGRDEHGDFAPVSFRSFGDYKAPAAIYITGVSTTVFGLSEWSTRLPFAILGILTIVITFWLAKNTLHNPWYGALAAWLLTILPWHITFTRVAFESGMATFFFALFLAAWIQLRTNPNMKAWAVAVLATVASLYTYHSAKIVLPGSIMFIAAYELSTRWAYWKKQWRVGLLSAVFGFILLIPFLTNSIWGPGLSRAGQTTVLSQAESLPTGVTLMLAQWFEHTQPSFLIAGETTTLRHSSGYRGILTWAHWGALWLGVLSAFAPWLLKTPEQSSQKRFSIKTRFVQWAQNTFPALARPATISPFVWLGLFLIGLLPAAVGFESPHANRALLASIPAVMLMTYGIDWLYHWKHTRQIIVTAAVASLLLVMTLEWGSWWKTYSTVYPAESSQAWMEGYVSTARLAKSYVDQGKRVRFTSTYGEPAIFYAFANHLPFDEYRSQQFGSITFGPIQPWETNQFDIIVTGSNPLPLSLLETINRRDGQPAFHIYATQ